MKDTINRQHEIIMVLIQLKRVGLQMLGGARCGSAPEGDS
jgi:hypothetical protein